MMCVSCAFWGALTSFISLLEKGVTPQPRHTMPSFPESVTLEPHSGPAVASTGWVRNISYSTNFSVIESSLWQYDTSCFDCSAKNPDECTKNIASAVRPASIAQSAGLTITTARLSNLTTCSPVAGGHSGKLSFKPAVSFGTIRVKSKYFPGGENLVKTAKGFIGLEDSSSGAITITIHGKVLDPPNPNSSTPIASCSILWHAILLHPTPSYPILPHPIPSHPIPSKAVSSHPIPSYLVLCGATPSYPALLPVQRPFPPRIVPLFIRRNALASCPHALTHFQGATASGAPKKADWTRYMQSSCYQHGDDHTKVFTELDKSVNFADNFNWFEVTWTPDIVTILVNGQVARTVKGASNIPQNPLHVQLHSRSIGYSQMGSGSKFSSFIQEFQYEPLNASQLLL